MLQNRLPFVLITGGELMAAAIILPVVCTALVVMRFITRRTFKQAAGVEDWMSLAAMVGHDLMLKCT